MPKLICKMLFVALVLLSGCKSAPITQQEQDAASALFTASNPNMSGLFIYRNSGLTGKTSVKSVWLDGKPVGELQNYSYYYLQIPPGAHTLSTEAVFGNNDFRINTFAGKTYYVSQVFSQPVPGVGALFGAFISSARFEEVSEEDGQYRVLQCHKVVTPAMPKPAAETVQLTQPEHSAQPAIAAAPSTETAPIKSEIAAIRLRNLHSLYKDGLINKEEFESKKQEILRDM